MRYTTRIIVPPRVRRSGMPGAVGAGPRPQAIGVRRSLGFGDRLGAAAIGQVAVAAAHPGFAPFFAQHAADDDRTIKEVLSTATRAVAAARYRAPWGADADGLRTPQQVDEAADAGFTHFTIDLSEHIRADADELSPDALADAVSGLESGGELPSDWSAPYLDRVIDLPGGEGLRLTINPLRRAAVKFAAAIQHGARMSETVARANRGRPFEIEVSLDGTGAPVTAAEHLFLGLELEARGVRLTGLALRVAGRDLAAFDAVLGEHVAVASFCGPYKLSFRSATHDPALMALIGRRCGDLLHYKTSAESYLEALRLACQLEPGLFHQILTASGVATAVRSGMPEELSLDEPATASQLDRTADAALAASDSQTERSLKAALLELLDQRKEIYQEMLSARYERLIQGLNAG